MEANPHPFGSYGNYQSHTDSEQEAPTNRCVLRRISLVLMYSSLEHSPIFRGLHVAGIPCVTLLMNSFIAVVEL